MKRWLGLAATCWIGLVAAQTPANRSEREAATQARLDQVRAEIEKIAAAQQAINVSRDQNLAALREVDRAIAAAGRGVREREAELARQNAELARLEGECAAVEERLQDQRRALAGLVRSVYALGRHEQLKLLLAADSVERLNRSLIYYRYLQRDRLGRVTALLEELRALAAAQQAVDAQKQAVLAAQQEQQQALAVLQSQRTAQQRLIGELEVRYRDGTIRLRALGRDEAALQALLASLRDVFADIPRELASQSLAALRGRLPRPLAGTLRVGFGGRLPDGRGSQGWWLEAKPGSEVRAIAHGRVAFADWMKGYGLLLILDHGDGFLSLYAGNEALLVDAGDWVEAGAPVATVGRSGGQPASGLYFELRRAGRPLDPQSWFARPR